MGKNIVFCADGTWNGPDDDDEGLIGRTNVFKLFANLDGGPAASATLAEQERSVFNTGGKQVQVAKYLHGVGNSGNWLVHLLGGTIGAGLIARVVRGYTFISRNYLAGDRIFINGFSRGAYTARALAGMISTRGLLDTTSLDLTNKEEAYRLGLAVWLDYRREVNAHGGFFGTLRGILNAVAEPLIGHATSKLIPHVPIEAVAVWDTVGALGIPIYGRDGTLDIFLFTNNRLPAAVRVGLHAVATDEQRKTFTPSLWQADPRVTQVLFAGAHADVGGGYPDAGLSDGSYAWMADKLAALDLVFSDVPAYVPQPCSLAMAHRPWLRDPWPQLGIGPRRFPHDILVKRSIVERAEGGLVPIEDGDPCKYEPANADCFIRGFPIGDDFIVA